LSVAEFVRSACGRPLVVGCLLALVLTGISRVTEATGWAELIAQGMCAALAGALLVIALGIRGTERERFVTKPLGRLIRRTRVSLHTGRGPS
jgi:hypothetical protein